MTPMCAWEPIHGLRSCAEFSAFHEWIMSRVADGAAEQVEVKEPYSGSLMFRQAWFCHRESRTVWRLVWPDGSSTIGSSAISKTSVFGLVP
jgi:hypothetical protein